MTHEGQPIQIIEAKPVEKTIDSEEIDFFRSQWNKYAIATGVGIAQSLTHGGVNLEFGLLGFVGGLIGTEIWFSLVEPHIFSHDKEVEAQKEQK